MLLLHALGECAADWAPVTPSFSERFGVVAVDLRGHGHSDWPGVYSFQLMCDDIVRLMDRLGLAAVTLVGHSMGGVVAYLLAQQHPGRVERLIVEDACPPYRRERAIPNRPVADLDFDWAVVPAIVTAVNAGDPSTWQHLDAISAPTLVIGGGPDSHIPQDQLADVAARIPACDLVTIPVGHNIHSSDSQGFAATVLAWLDT